MQHRETLRSVACGRGKEYVRLYMRRKWEFLGASCVLLTEAAAKNEEEAAEEEAGYEVGEGVDLFCVRLWITIVG